MKIYCRHSACPLPKHEYDETEFMQYLQHLTPTDRDIYLASHWCPDCYERIHPSVPAPAEEKGTIFQTS